MKFERKILLAFLLASATVAVLVMVAVRTTYRLMEDSRRAGAAAEQRVVVEELEAGIFEAESVARAYAFTGDEVYRGEYESVSALVESILVELGELEVDPGPQAERVRRMAQEVRNRLGLLNELTGLRREQGEDAARTHVASRRGKTIMDRVRSLNQEFDQTQDEYIEGILDTEQRTSRQMLWLLLGFALLNVLVLGTSFFLMRREWRRGGGYVAQLQETTREMSLLSSMSGSLQSCGSIADAKDLMQHFMEKLFPRHAGTLYIIRASRNVLEVKAAWGDTSGWAPVMEPQDCWALRLGRMVEFSVDANNPPCAHVRDAGGGYLCVPMMAEGEALGMLHLREPKQAAGNGLAGNGNLGAQAERIAAQLGPVIASLTLREQFRMQSIRDGLTGLYNRRYLEETMGREIMRAHRSNTSLAVIMIDLDHFKNLNDAHGHQVGDEALQAFSVFLKDNVRGDDIACRYGGEEFAVAMPGVSLEMAVQRAERLRAGLANLRLRAQGQVLPPLTASFGVAAYAEHGDSWEALLRAADGALYAAKRAGRDRVIAADRVA